MVDVTLTNSAGTREVGVTSLGELVVGDYDYASPYFVSLADANIYELVEGRADRRFVITGFWITAQKDVSPTDAGTTTIYEASKHDLATVNKIITSVDLVRNTVFPSPAPLRLHTEIAQSIVVVTTDPTVNVTVVGYYTPSL